MLEKILQNFKNTKDVAQFLNAEIDVEIHSDFNIMRENQYIGFSFHNNALHNLKLLNLLQELGMLNNVINIFSSKGLLIFYTTSGIFDCNCKSTVEIIKYINKKCMK